MRLTCPRCATTFTPAAGATPVCPSCGYTTAATAPAPAYGAPAYGSTPAMNPPATAYAPTTPGYGAPPAYGATPAGYAMGPAKTNGLAIAALVLGIVGLCIGLTAPVGLILGIVATNQIKQRNEGGQGMAVTGIVLGAIGTLFLVIWLMMMMIAPQAILREF